MMVSASLEDMIPLAPQTGLRGNPNRSTGASIPPK